MKALVLSGGGSKGSYQIGVWKALKKLHIKFDIVTGTSSGAINGVLITQNSYFKALKIWKKLSYKNIFGDEFTNSNEIKTLYKTFAKNFISDGGTEVNELHELIKANININRFYKSKINYGLVTFNLTTMKPIQLEKKDIPKEQLSEYILASASCFPAFKKMNIEGNDYIDGGYYDNIPINLAINMGADEAIVVDLASIGLKKKPKKKIKTITIKPNNQLSNFLLFDKEASKKNMKYGYNDTLKVFNKLEGIKYTFKINEIKKFEDLFFNNYKKILYRIFDTKEQIEKFNRLIKIETKEKLKREFVNLIIEDIGYKYNIDDTRIYTCYSFNNELTKKVVKDLRKEKEDSILYFYRLLQDEEYRSIKKEAIIRPFDLLRAIYIYSVME